jgi:tetratricopeptide (TPR) repeat protein
LPDTTTDLLRVAAAFTGGIDFEVTRRVAGLEERAALDALDAALGAQLLAAAGGPTAAYDFTHALVRHTLYEGLSPARQVRLHRAIAETMEAAYGDAAIEHAAEIARHYHRSATLPGAERGVPFCMAAADQAERSAAFADVAGHLRAALDLLPAKSAERPRVLARLGLALAYALRFDEAVGTARDAAAEIAETESRQAAASYLMEAIYALRDAGAATSVGALCQRGLDYVGKIRDATGAVLKTFEAVDRQANDPAGLGISVDTEEGGDITEILKASAMLWAVPSSFLAWRSRADILNGDPFPEYDFRVGEYRSGLPLLREAAEQSEQQGKIGRAVEAWASVARFHAALGEFAAAQEARNRGATLAERLPEPSIATAQLIGAEDEWRLAMDEGWDFPMQRVGPRPGEGQPRRVYRAANVAAIARMHAHMGRVEPAMRRLSSVLLAIERAPGWAENYPRIACDAAETLWLTERTDHIEVIERNLREKVIDPDFRYPMMDGRLALARLCALQQRIDEAADWFAKARTVLDEQGARPLRAIVDYDEALMYARRGGPGDPERARPLLDAALRQFRSLGMPGWIRRAEALLESCAARGARGEEHSQ